MYMILKKMEKTTWLELRSSIVFKEKHVFIEEEDKLSQKIVMVYNKQMVL